MQNFKNLILKNLCSAVIFFTYLLVMPSVWMAEGSDVPPQIFIGDTPSAIIVQRGMPVKVPIFFVGGTFTNKNVELFVYRVDTEENVVCFGPDGWESGYVTALEDFKPLGSLGMPEYVYVDWPALDNSQSLLDCSLCVCVDDQIDGIFTASSYCCGCQSIIIEEVDDSTGDDNDTGTGDDSGSGDDDDSGSGGSLIPTNLPAFPDIGGDSDGACNSLEYTPEGTTFSYSSISKSLELGESEQITLLASACGSSVTVSSVNKTTGGEWLKASSGGGSKVILNLNAGVTGLQTGSTYTGTVTVVAGGITDNMYVTLRVLGQCDPTSASVTPTSLTFQAYVGGQSPSAQTLRVKDNCGDAVYATVLSKPAWLTLSNAGTGVFSVSCVDSYLEEEESHSGTITLTDSDYSKQHSVSVTLEVTDTPPPPADDSVRTLTSGDNVFCDIGAGQFRYFKFVAGVPDCQHPIQVINTPKADQPRTVHLLVKRGSKPTIDDFNRTWEMDQSLSGAGDLYWKYNTGSQAELVEITEPMESNTFYIMLYNNGTRTVSDQRLTLSYYD